MATPLGSGSSSILMYAPVLLENLWVNLATSARWRTYKCMQCFICIVHIYKLQISKSKDGGTQPIHSLAIYLSIGDVLSITYLKSPKFAQIRRAQLMWLKSPSWQVRRHNINFLARLFSMPVAAPNSQKSRNLHLSAREIVVHGIKQESANGNETNAIHQVGY